MDWVDFYAQDPFGLERMDFGFAQVCSTIANVHGNKSKPQDFMPFANTQTEADKIKGAIRGL